MLTVYLVGFALMFTFYWVFMSEKTYEESTDMFCSLIFSFTWPLWFTVAVVSAIALPFVWLHKKLN